MAVLLIAETAGGDLVLDPTAKAVTAAAALGEITALVCGSDAAAAAATALDGVAKVWVAGDDAYAKGLAENIADLIIAQAEGFSHIVAPATASGKNILPRVAALLDVMVISDVTEILDAETFKRPIYAGNAIQTVKSADA
ncbi:MAG: electron transfer flavoprotein subunit alpha/FixB family protein, partial [Pseudomonadota bacterium]